MSSAAQGQQRTLTRTFDKMLGIEGAVRMCDRTALILDIFAQRAATHEGQLQVIDLLPQLLHGSFSCQGWSVLLWLAVSVLAPYSTTGRACQEQLSAAAPESHVDSSGAAGRRSEQGYG